MSKLPIVSGAEVVRALGKVGFVVYRQRGSHITMVRGTRQRKQQFPIIKNSIAALCVQLFVSLD